MQPVYVRRVSIRDALQGQGGLINGGLKAFFSSVKLAEPTFRVRLSPFILPSGRKWRFKAFLSTKGK